jgi:ribosomal protein L7Ae-like RNA K-turn-binding protein
MKEVKKHLNAENLKMIILAVNLERVEEDNGLDELVGQIIQTTRDQKIPLVFCLSRYKLGFVSKFQSQLASIVGIFNF